MSFEYEEDDEHQDNDESLLINKLNTKNHEILIHNKPDVCLISKKNSTKKFKTHKLVLAKYCTKLDIAKLSDEIYLNSNEDSIAYLLLHLYIPPLKLNDENLLDCALISYEIGCLSLTDRIKRYIKRYLKNLSLISSMLSMDKLCLYVNICDILNFIELYNLLLKLLKDNLNNLLNDEFNFVNLNINTLKCIVKHAKNDSCLSHFKLFIKLYKWILHESCNRDQYTQELLLNVDFKLINVSNLLEIEHNFKQVFDKYSILNDKFNEALKKLAIKGKLKKEDNLNINNNNNGNNLEKRIFKATVVLILSNLITNKSKFYDLIY